MLRTKSLITGIDQVPREWVFEYYLGLDEKLTGQRVQIKSAFNPADKRPSMYIYLNARYNAYHFSDYSVDKSGDGIQLVLELFKLASREQSTAKIITDYTQYLYNNGDKYKDRVVKRQENYRVTNYRKRSWSSMDQKLWNSFHLGSSDLEWDYIFPLEYYEMSKDIDGIEKKLIISHSYIYGYFKADGTLYKIYQPFARDSKFVKVKEYIQGLDRLTFEAPYLIILSSLKDIAFFRKLRIKNAELIAPDSENVMVPDHMIEYFKQKYKAICTLFDNDDAGKKAMEKYRVIHSIPPALLELSKDVSDSGRDYGIEKVREVVIPLLKKTLNIK